jgi:hypothetical protein
MMLRKRIGYSEFVRQDRALKYVASERTTVVVGTALGLHQVCQITFGKKDGSIYVQCPYFKHKAGIVAALEIPTEVRGAVTYNMQEAGKVTSHLVKYAHHPDGSVHFSQDGKVRTEIRGMSFSLREAIGPVFEIHGFYLGGFETITWAKPGRAYLPFVFYNGLPTTIQVSAQWRRRSDIIENIQPRGGTTGPLAEIQSRRTRMRGVAYFLGPPVDFPIQSHVLMIECGNPEMPSTIDRDTLIMMGGWNVEETTLHDPGKPATSFLMAMYPVQSPEKLVYTIGTIDYRPDRV